MKCPSCGIDDLAPVPGADLYRCANCQWTVTQAEYDAGKKRSRAAKKAAKSRRRK